MASLSNVNQLFKDLKTEFSKSKPDLKKCGNLLESLKVSKQKSLKKACKKEFFNFQLNFQHSTS